MRVQVAPDCSHAAVLGAVVGSEELLDEGTDVAVTFGVVSLTGAEVTGALLAGAMGVLPLVLGEGTGAVVVIGDGLTTEEGVLAGVIGDGPVTDVDVVTDEEGAAGVPPEPPSPQLANEADTPSTKDERTKREVKLRRMSGSYRVHGRPRTAVVPGVQRRPRFRGSGACPPMSRLLSAAF